MDLGDVAKGVKNAAPKLETVAKDAMDWTTQANKRTKAHEKQNSTLEDLKNNLSTALVDYKNGNTFQRQDSYKVWDDTKNEYTLEIDKMMKNLQPPQSVKDNINDEMYYLESEPPSSELSFDLHNLLSDYHDRIALLPPNEKKQFDTLVDIYKNEPGEISQFDGSMNFASSILPRLRKLDPAQQDTFLKMLPDWEQSLDDLEVAARLL